jgi:hypothetical protein
MKTFKQLKLELKNYYELKLVESDEKRFCPKCKKMETKSECSYGPEYWEKNAKKM